MEACLSINCRWVSTETYSWANSDPFPWASAVTDGSAQVERHGGYPDGGCRSIANENMCLNDS